MAKKDLSRINTDLAQLARTLPSQNIGAPMTERNDPAPTEDIIQFSLSLRKSLRKQLAHLANDADMTMRAFVLLALRDKGLHVTDEDLLDLRKGRG